MGARGIDAFRQGVTQTAAYTGTSATVTNPFGAQTYLLRIVANSACHYKVVEAAGGAATVTDSFLPASWVEYLIVSPGQKISAIQAATAGLITGTAGSLFVTEMT